MFFRHYWPFNWLFMTLHIWPCDSCKFYRPNKIIFHQSPINNFSVMLLSLPRTLETRPFAFYREFKSVSFIFKIIHLQEHRNETFFSNLYSTTVCISFAHYDKVLWKNYMEVLELSKKVPRKSLGIILYFLKLKFLFFT